jgi:hypothetical protein
MKRWLQILETVGPMLLSFVPATQAIVPFVVAGIGIAEQIPGATGPQKKTFVEQLIALAAGATNTATGKTTIDPTAAVTAAGSAIDTVVGIVNLIHKTVPSAP